MDSILEYKQKYIVDITTHAESLKVISDFIELSNITKIIIKSCGAKKDNILFKILSKIPRTVSTLIFKSYTNFTLPDLSYTKIKYISFMKHCEYDMELPNLPNTLEYIKFGGYYNQSIDNLPDSVKTIILRNLFNRPINKLPSNLRYLCLNSECNQVLINFPPRLKYLNIKCYKLSNLPPLPAKLRYLYLDCDTNLPILPQKLRYLFIDCSRSYSLLMNHFTTSCVDLSSIKLRTIVFGANVSFYDYNIVKYPKTLRKIIVDYTIARDAYYTPYKCKYRLRKKRDFDKLDNILSFFNIKKYKNNIFIFENLIYKTKKYIIIKKNMRCIILYIIYSMQIIPFDMFYYIYNNFNYSF